MHEARSGAQGDLAQRVLQILALGALLLTSLWIVRPFLLAAAWATTIAVATWPLLLRMQGWLAGRRWLAVTAMTLGLLLVVVLPLYLGVRAVLENTGDITELSQSLATWSVPQPPEWLDGVPLVGKRIADEWREAAAWSSDELAAHISPYARDFARWLVAELGSVGALLLNFLLTVALTALLYANGEGAASGLLRFARRLAGARGEEATHLAAQAVRAVALGVVVTAVLQSSLVGVGLAVVGVPFTAVLTAICFILAVAQIGPIPVLIGAVIWTYSTLGAVWGTALLVWSIFCGTIDNVVRPVLIKRGADLPLLLIFSGVVGGLFAFGVLGLFVGPVVLAVAYTLLLEWMNEAPES